MQHMVVKLNTSNPVRSTEINPGGFTSSVQTNFSDSQYSLENFC